jgi:hypothetical protein
MAASPGPGSDRVLAALERLLDEIDERNADNVARTESYLELYALTRAHPPDWPWLLLAHFVSRNAGYMMSGLREAIDDPRRAFGEPALVELFLFLERANYLIFYDAWHHVVSHLMGRPLAPGRTPRFVHEAYARHRRNGDERCLVFDLIENEQNYIEHRVVHRAGFERARALVSFFESVGAERSMRFGGLDSGITVGGFASLHRRIATGQRLFDVVLRDRGRRDELYVWARAQAHTGSRADYGGRATVGLRRAWPVATVRALDAGIHAPAEPDPRWP